MYYLIDNFSQVVLKFEKKKDLFRYAKERGFKPKKCLLSENCYWLDNAF